MCTFCRTEYGAKGGPQKDTQGYDQRGAPVETRVGAQRAFELRQHRVRFVIGQ